MPRSARIVPGDMVFHVLNRGVDRKTLFASDADYAAFESILEETLSLCPMRICAYCLMPNHWHMVVWPQNDRDLPVFMHRLTVTHAMRWKTLRGTTGTGHLYQGRYKSFPVEIETGFYPVARYVERNALRARLVKRAEEWRWSSLWRRCKGHGTDAMLSAWPVEYTSDWLSYINAPQDDEETNMLRQCVRRGQPYGGEQWAMLAAQVLDLTATVQSHGRPRKGDRSRLRGLL